MDGNNKNFEHLITLRTLAIFAINNLEMLNYVARSENAGKRKINKNTEVPNVQRMDTKQGRVVFYK